MDHRKEERQERESQERKGSEEHPGAHGEKVRVPESPEQDPGRPPIGNGAVNEPAAFPPHN